MTGKRKQWFLRILFIIGFLICAYPVFSGIYERMQQTGVLQTYETRVHRTDEDVLDKALEEAVHYNDRLLQTQGAYIPDLEADILSHEHYMELLNLSKNGIMASIEIPKINVNLPIYHGTEEKELSNGVGHLESSSLPTGGKGTHCILTGHRGLPNSKLFTRLDELKKNDLFYIHLCGKTLAYQIEDIRVVKPEELEQFPIEADRDLISLITCTPYGINTHRLVVTGKRTPYKKAVKESIQPKMMSLRELIFTFLPFGILLIILIREYLKKRKEKQTCERN